VAVIRLLAGPPGCDGRPGQDGVSGCQILFQRNPSCSIDSKSSADILRPPASNCRTGNTIRSVKSKKLIQDVVVGLKKKSIRVRLRRPVKNKAGWSRVIFDNMIE
jgi:hypothetical protein